MLIVLITVTINIFFSISLRVCCLILLVISLTTSFCFLSFSLRMENWREFVQCLSIMLLNCAFNMGHVNLLFPFDYTRLLAHCIALCRPL
jgi:hypothetical protein